MQVRQFHSLLKITLRLREMQERKDASLLTSFNVPHTQVYLFNYFLYTQPRKPQLRK